MNNQNDPAKDKNFIDETVDNARTQKDQVCDCLSLNDYLVCIHIINCQKALI